MTIIKKKEVSFIGFLKVNFEYEKKAILPRGGIFGTRHLCPYKLYAKENIARTFVYLYRLLFEYSILFIRNYTESKNAFDHR